jgi:hypothetical protein
MDYQRDSNNIPMHGLNSIDNIASMNTMPNNFGGVNSNDTNNMNNMNNMNNLNNMNISNNSNNSNNMSGTNMNDTYMNNLHVNNNNMNNQNNQNNMNNRGFIENPNNNFADALKEINETKFNGTDLNYKQSGGSVSDNESLINTITNEISNRLGADKKISSINELKENINNKEKNKEKNKPKTIEKMTKDSSSEVKKSNDIIEKILSYDDVRDFMIIFAVFFLLSQDMIKDFFSEYVTYLNPDDEGKIGVKGVFVYGVLLAVLFLVIRKFL